jgi:hypothetical protein
MELIDDAKRFLFKKSRLTFAPVGETLTELKGILQGSTGNALSSWTSSSFYCTWQGVSCADTTVIKV